MSTQTDKHRAELDAWVREKVEREGAEYCELVQCLIDFSLDELASGAPNAHSLAQAYLMVSEGISQRVNDLVQASVMHEVSKH
ncbi:hypothetical protein [Hyphomicrobium sulfonivorans]|uniref:hypothetical protein n=1 Tax=Hyphomicrobium sulfonivorans TaxID=121290 RepID=UPI00156E2BE1|nr:hypothetical protein [Hyphomicrobium sulfonivorans]MBI1650117.1 hypothetical protein [Hyphomicrobium sulfonivorans]NSL73032.1 hypothetical protein [Hyphomicrobium sulfonivorans]